MVLPSAPCIAKFTWSFMLPEHALETAGLSIVDLNAQSTDPKKGCVCRVLLRCCTVLCECLLFSLLIALLLLRLPFFVIGLIPWACDGFDERASLTSWYAPFVFPCVNAFQLMENSFQVLASFITRECFPVFWERQTQEGERKLAAFQATFSDVIDFTETTP